MSSSGWHGSTTITKDLATDTWVKASWEEFILLIENPTYPSSVTLG
jgi:hypothetical protein